MKYNIQFKYLDSEELNIEMHSNNLDKFMKCIGEGQVYFDEERQKGIWIGVDKVRYFTITKIEEQ